MWSGLRGVEFLALHKNSDHRGVLTELFRESWIDTARPVQWNFVQSAPNVLRGVHCHIRHHDFLTVTGGSLILGLIDLRVSSPSFLTSELHEVGSGEAMVVLPPGIGHGFYFDVPSQMVYGVSDYWSTDDELGCRWDDPSLGIEWPCSSPVVSRRDEDAGSLEDLIVGVTRGIESVENERVHPSI